MTTMVTVPPGAPESVCWMAFVTSSEVSKVAASQSTPGTPARVRAMKDLAPATCSGLPGTVTEPRIAARCLVPDV